MKIKNTITSLFTLIIIFGFTLSTKAADNDLGIGLPLPGRETNPDGSPKVPYAGYQDYIQGAYQFAMIAGGVLSILMIIYAGYRYMTSQGNPTAINDAKDILIGSLSGFALLLLSYLVLKVLGIPVTG